MPRTRSHRKHRYLPALVASLVLLAAPAWAVPLTFTVDSTGDGEDAAINGTCAAAGGACTLRAALQEANANAGTDTIAFAIPPLDGTVKTITPAAQLPTITDPVVIDGYTQDDAHPNTLALGGDALLRIELNGATVSITVAATGLFIASGGSGSTVRGLVINRFVSFAGLRIDGATDCIIEGNFVGTDPTGTIDLGNQSGISVNAGTDNLIGGTAPAARNLVSGNGVEGVHLTNGQGSTVQGNFIGTDATGTAALGNGGGGVVATNESGPHLGGPSSGARNIISGNLEGLFFIAVAGAVVEGNFIGTDVTGTAPLGNAGPGLDIINSPDLLVGGIAPGAGNVISANSGPSGDGIRLLNAPTTNAVVQGNFIGTDVTGTVALGNSLRGIASNAPASTIGGTAAGAGNVIAGNTFAGIALFGAITGTRILGNSIFDNGSLGIDLGLNGVTANDDGDGDGNDNNQQNFPILALPFVGGTSVTGTLNSTPGGTFRIEVFTNDACDPSGNGEGKTFVGTVDTAATDGNGDVGFTVVFGQSLPAGAALTATATDLVTGDTSEFSLCPLPPPTPTPTSTATATPTPTPTATPGPATADHFMGYAVVTTKGAAKLVPLGPVTLADRFRSAGYDVAKLGGLLAPADKNGEGRNDPATHLLEYRVKAAKGVGKLAKRSDVQVVNQCNDVLLQVSKPVSLLVPAAQSQAGPVVQPDPLQHERDHYLCYAAKAQKKRSDGTPLAPLPKRQQVVVEDQFQTRRYDLKKITKLCQPVDKSGSPVLLKGPNAGDPVALEPATIRHPADFLVCYQAKAASKLIAQTGCVPSDPADKGSKIVPKPPKHTPVRGIHVATQLGALQIDTKKERELCIPSTSP